MAGDIQSRYGNARLFFVSGVDVALRWNEAIWLPEEITDIGPKDGSFAGLTHLTNRCSSDGTSEFSNSARITC
jgi:hypothetical protein